MNKIKLHISHLSPLFNEALDLVKNSRYELSFQNKLISTVKAPNENALADTIQDVDVLYGGETIFILQMYYVRQKN